MISYKKYLDNYDGKRARKSRKIKMRAHINIRQKKIENLSLWISIKNF